MCKNHFDITAGINLIRSLRCEIVLLLTDDTALKQNQSPQPEINRPITGHIHSYPLLSSWLANQKRERSLKFPNVSGPLNSLHCSLRLR